MIQPVSSRLDAWFDGLWSNYDFRRLWLSLTITHFGGQITFLALPLTAALLLSATPFEMGVLTALESLPFALFGLFAGVLVDRSRKLPLIITADVGRALVLLAVPVAAWTDTLAMPVLYAVGFLVGTGSVVAWAAYQVFMTERVGRANLVAANSKIALADSSAQLVGPGLAGFAIHWLTAPIAILLDALAFALSAWMLRGIPPRESDAPSHTQERSVWHDIGEGLQQIRRTPVLRSIAWGVAAWNFLRHMFIAVIILYATQELNLSAGVIGVAWMSGGVGCIAASFATRRMNLHRGVGEVMLGGVFLTGIAWGVIALAPAGTWWLAAIVLGAGLLAYDFGGTLFFINYLSLRQAVTPDHLLGRVISTMIFLTILTAPLGSLLGGALAEWSGLRTTLWIAAGSGMLLGLVLLRLSPIAALRSLPHHGA